MSALSRWLDRSLGRRIAAMVSLLLMTVRRARRRLLSPGSAGHRAECRREAPSPLSVSSPRSAGTGPGDRRRASSARLAADAGGRPDADRRSPTETRQRSRRPGLRGSTRRAIAVVDRDGRTVMVKRLGAREPGWLRARAGGHGGAAPECRPVGCTSNHAGADSTLYYDIGVPVRAGGVIPWRAGGPGAGQPDHHPRCVDRPSLGLPRGDRPLVIRCARATGVWTDLRRPDPVTAGRKALSLRGLSRVTGDSAELSGVRHAGGSRTPLDPGRSGPRGSDA